MRTQDYLLLMLALSCKPVHGNGTVEGTEQCDDGNAQDGDGCNISCEIETCGDGIVNNGGLEQCDDGNQDNDDGCSSVCRKERCGDGIVNNAKEQCDDDNVDNNDGCNSRCQFEFCGDGIVNNKTEACDDGQRVDSGCVDCQLPPEPEGPWDLFLSPQRVKLKHALVNAWIATKDINKDGILDLVTLDFDGSASVALGKGDGTLEEHFSLTLSPRTSVTGGALGDFNGDGWMDLISYSNTSVEAHVYLGTDTFNFDIPAPLDLKRYPFAVSVADFNKDGKDDVVIAIDVELRIWLGGNGGLKKSTKLSKEYFTGTAVADFNGDSYLDIAALDFKEVTIFLGSRGGSFPKQQIISLGSDAPNFIAGDINNDGISDLIVGGEKLSTITYAGKGKFVVEEGPDLVGRYFDLKKLGACDFNNDGNLDVAVLEKNLFRVFLNSGTGTFEDKYHKETKTSWFSMFATGDINKDGECDIVTTAGWSPEVWLGDGTSKTKKEEAP